MGYDKELQIANLTEKQKTEIKARERDALRAITDKEAADEEKYLDTLQREYEKTGEQIMNAFDSQFNAILTYHETWGTAMGKIVEKLGMDFLKAAEKMVVDWAASQLAMTQASVAGSAARTAAESASSTASAAATIPNALHVIADAAQAYAGVFAFFAPLLGLGAAGPAAAASGAVMAAGGAVASADIGMYNVPSDQLAMIHRNELIMPAAQAGAFRGALDSMANGGDSGAGGRVSVSPQAHFHINSMDSATVASTLMNNHGAVAKAMDRAVRHGAVLGLRGLRR